MTPHNAMVTLQVEARLASATGHLLSAMADAIGMQFCDSPLQVEMADDAVYQLARQAYSAARERRYWLAAQGKM